MIRTICIAAVLATANARAAEEKPTWIQVDDTIYGASCDELRSGSVSEIAVDYGCGGEPVIVK